MPLHASGPHFASKTIGQRQLADGRPRSWDTLTCNHWMSKAYSKRTSSQTCALSLPLVPAIVTSCVIIFSSTLCPEPPCVPATASQFMEEGVPFHGLPNHLVPDCLHSGPPGSAHRSMARRKMLAEFQRCTSALTNSPDKTVGLSISCHSFHLGVGE